MKSASCVVVGSQAEKSVGIADICAKKTAKACSVDAFRRRGYDIGMRTAAAKGWDKTSPKAKALAKVGYTKAGKFLESLTT